MKRGRPRKDRGDLKAARSSSLASVYESGGQPREKLDKMVDLLFRLIFKSAGGAEPSDSLTISQFCRGLRKLGFVVTPGEISRGLSLSSAVGDDYRLDVVRFEDGANRTRYHYPPIDSDRESHELSHVTRDTLRQLLLGCGLRLSLTGTIY